MVTDAAHPPALAAGEIISLPVSAGSSIPSFELREGACSSMIASPATGRPSRCPSAALVVKRLPVRIAGNLYDLSWIDFHSTDPGHECAVSGTGSHYRRTEQETETSVDL